MHVLQQQSGRGACWRSGARKVASRASARAARSSGRSSAVAVRAVAAPVLPIAEDTITIRSLDWDRDRFDIEFGLENGTTYNAYLIYGADKTALVDASHEKFHNLFLEALQKELAAAGRRLDYIFVSHTEPDHSGLIPAVLDQYPEATVCGSKELVAVMGRSKGLVLMSPPRDSADARTALAALSSAIKPKTKVVIAESYGGRDEPVDVLAASLQDVGAEILAPPLRIKDLPAQPTYQLFEEEGTDLAQALTAKETIARKKAAMGPDVAKALARLSSGLYVVTAQHNNARSAMVASWVSQASFEPLGLTIAVAKDRAIESLMQVIAGNVTNSSVRTAVHRRKVANYY
ncbi:hypothetical protein GPECTOR_122g459 [Gonium pectorale]|uniref:Metallo-beta-lactamase domain-containing protein n=1 Tax=Gonium pectorale TaxID=33097 RepID=A0A150FYQ7_GONPE|nr:hypothetical protein GPECTOR_122g459 [Gonium pectorale]|eukprot:KXZ42718.1 hypothetical protein GPECTOR_122g459 [Gonium pectorale]